MPTDTSLATSDNMDKRTEPQKEAHAQRTATKAVDAPKKPATGAKRPPQDRPSKPWTSKANQGKARAGYETNNANKTPYHRSRSPPARKTSPIFTADLRARRELHASPEQRDPRPGTPPPSTLAALEPATVLVSNLHPDASAEDLEAYYSHFGSVTDIQLLYFADGRYSRDARICFARCKDAQDAMDSTDGGKLTGT